MSSLSESDDLSVCVCVCVLDCEKLIRKMLQLDPSKRIPLSAVLKHRWMEGVNCNVDVPLKCRRGSIVGAGECVKWNDHVLMAIRNMNCDVDACKRVSCSCK